MVSSCCNPQLRKKYQRQNPNSQVYPGLVAGAMQAMAAHNSGGVVIVQVERIVDRGTLPTRNAHIPGALVDKIVLAPAENHWMHLGSGLYDGSLSGAHLAQAHDCCCICPLYLRCTSCGYPGQPICP